VLDALFFAIVVDRHVAERAQTEFGDLAVLLLKGGLCEFVVQQHAELGDGRLAEQGFDAEVAKGQVHEGLQQVDQVLGVLLQHHTFARVTDKAFYHCAQAGVLDHALTPVVVHGQLFESPRGSLANFKALILK